MSSIQDSLRLKAAGSKPVSTVGQKVVKVTSTNAPKGVKITSTGVASVDKSNARF